MVHSKTGQNRKREREAASKASVNGRSPGTTGISVKLLESSGKTLKTFYQNYLIKQKKTNIPDKWNMAYITSVYKNAVWNDFSNYGSISVMRALGKIFGRITKEQPEKGSQRKKVKYRMASSKDESVWTVYMY
jgi:hypothetical protein